MSMQRYKKLATGHSSLLMEGRLKQTSWERNPSLDFPDRNAFMKTKPEPWRELGFPSHEAFQFPNIVNIEVYRGACPCRCVHCPVGSTLPAERAEWFGQKGMDLALYDKITREVAMWPSSTVRMHSVGDPILWSDLPAALSLGRKNGARTWIFTSAVTADRSLLNAVCVGADIVEVSVNSTSRQDYLQTKGIDRFDLVLDNIRYMSELSRRETKTRLIASRTQTDDLKADEAFVAYWQSSGLVDTAFVRSYHTYNGLMPEIAERSGPDCRRQPCLVHWARFNISVGGVAILCFNELFRRTYDPELILGDLRRESIADIWRGPKLRAVRQSELTGNDSGAVLCGALPCGRCSSPQPLGGGRPTSEYQIQKLADGAKCQAR